MKKSICSYWGIIIIALIISQIGAWIVNSDIGEPQTKTLQYDAKFERFYFMENDNAIIVKFLNTNDHLREGMMLDIYDCLIGDYFYPQGTPKKNVQYDAYVRLSGVCFLATLLVIMVVLFFFALRTVNEDQKKNN